jgi:hypothetical protein
VLEGALILLAGIAIGRLLPARRKGPGPPPKPVCGCGHHFSYHDPETRACGYASRPVVHSTAPLPSFYAPEIAGETGQ